MSDFSTPGNSITTVTAFFPSIISTNGSRDSDTSRFSSPSELDFILPNSLISAFPFSSIFIE